MILLVYYFTVLELICLLFIFQDSDDSTESSASSATQSGETKVKGRTGWPQEVWASELRGSPPLSQQDLSIPGSVSP